MDGRPLTLWALCLCVAAMLSVAAAQTCTLQPPSISDAELSTICSTDPAYSSPACSIHRLCFDTTLTPAMYPQMCNNTRVASSLCLDDANIVSGIPQCTSFASLRTTALSPACVTALGIFSIRSTSATRAAAATNCDDMSGMAMAGCDVCSLTSCRDPLVALGLGCSDMPDMSQCNLSQEPQIKVFCSTDANIGGWGRAAAAICFVPNRRVGIVAPPRPPPLGVTAAPPPVASPPPPVPSPVVPRPAPSPAASQVPSPSPAPVPSPSPSPPTVMTPSPSPTSVTQYPLTTVNSDISRLCTSMPDMPGCSVQKACMANNLDQNSKYCAPMTLLATLCTDMPEMKNGCTTYTTVCAPGSTVPECAQYPPIPNIPGWDSSRSAVLSICNDMTMDQCSACNTMSCPSPLDTLVALCADMPDMSQCTIVNSWCSAVSGGMDYYCKSGGGSSSGLPPMQMYFHQRFEDIVLWKAWIPRTQGQYVGTVFCILAFGVVSMALKALQGVLSISWRHSPAMPRPGEHANWWLPTGGQIPHNLVKGFIMSLATCLDYFNMLVAMTFNVGLFVAVVLGYALGAVLFSHIPENYSAAQSARRADTNGFAHGQPPTAAALFAATKMEDGTGHKNGSDSPTSTGMLHATDVEHPACCPQPM